MRKIVYSASAFLLALSSMFVSCSKSEQGGVAEVASKATKIDTTSRATALASYIRYVDMQRISEEYTLSSELIQADSLAQIKLMALQNQLQTNLQRKAQAIQEKLQRNGYLTEASYNAEMAQFQKEQQNAENTIAQRQRDYADDMLMKQQQLNDSVTSVINDICRQMQLDAVINRSAGLYFNPALDITDLVVAELNRRYKPAN